MKTKPASDRALDAAVYGLLLLAASACLFPFLNVLSKSLSANWAVTSGRVGLWPVGFNLENLFYVVTDRIFLHALGISVLVTAAGTLGAVLFTAVSAYPLSKKHLPGVKFVLIMYVFTMLFNGGMIPSYLLIKQLGMMNHLSSLVLPGLINVFNMLLVKNYFESLPESLEESAKLDGASNLTIVLRIIVPISAPVFATVSLFYAVAFWSDWFHPMLYLSDPSLKPLQLYLRDIVLESDTSGQNLDLNIDQLMNISPEGIRNATVIVSTVPILLVYPFLQRYFIRGILVGSVKG
ncbi:carbohydrate ABC transporter permease [Paenibacillus humicola]|uniref:carbohydrate ABC transporter permease n=1 Tax=Paenibacillus humicola TaxID=3110540 RepID=UPI00237C3168|nr:carbohydrate ABC transporter permease [Paenibacillus humicola]